MVLVKKKQSPDDDSSLYFVVMLMADLPSVIIPDRRETFRV